jgi:hypothetical protein
LAATSNYPQGGYNNPLGKPPGQLPHPQPGISNPLGLGQGVGGYIQTSAGPSALGYQPQQNRFVGQGQSLQQSLQNRDFQQRFGGAMGAPNTQQGLGGAAIPPGLGGMANSNAVFAGSPGLGFGGGGARSHSQLLQDLWTQQQLGNQQKQLQIERQVCTALLVDAICIFKWG